MGDARPVRGTAEIGPRERAAHRGADGRGAGNDQPSARERRRPHPEGQAWPPAAESARKVAGISDSAATAMRLLCDSKSARLVARSIRATELPRLRHRPARAAPWADA